MANEIVSENLNPRSNVPELTVSELAFSLKKTLEETYGRVRIRGELSRVKIHTSGHMYSDLKDENACINVVCWKGTMANLSIRPEEGLEVICTGRISTYPARSNYQLIIESMELAGEGALLKMLEERKKKLAAEGLFAAERKKKLPFLPERIGVITSPTGAVIRDIMHRLNDRFPRPVLLWPVLVQGPGAAEQIAAAIRGFDAMTENRPDLLIVARGGGSLEDLMAFNEEIVVRAAAECTIPLISAVGHETDTTLIDYAADLRAPTPTGAAEMAVPRRIDLLAGISDDEHRLIGAGARLIAKMEERLGGMAARLGDPQRLLETKIQLLDHVAHKLTACFEAGLSCLDSRLREQGALLRHPRSLIDEKDRTLGHLFHKLESCFRAVLARDNSHIRELAARLRPPDCRLAEKRLEHAGQMLKSLSYQEVLKRGYVLVRDEAGKPVTQAGQTRTGQSVQLLFRDNQSVDAIIGKGAPGAIKPKKPQYPRDLEG